MFRNKIGIQQGFKRAPFDANCVNWLQQIIDSGCMLYLEQTEFAECIGTDVFVIFRENIENVSKLLLCMEMYVFIFIHFFFFFATF